MAQGSDEFNLGDVRLDVSLALHLALIKDICDCQTRPYYAGFMLHIGFDRCLMLGTISWNKPYLWIKFLSFPHAVSAKPYSKGQDCICVRRLRNVNAQDVIVSRL